MPALLERWLWFWNVRAGDPWRACLVPLGTRMGSARSTETWQVPMDLVWYPHKKMGWLFLCSLHDLLQAGWQRRAGELGVKTARHQWHGQWACDPAVVHLQRFLGYGPPGVWLPVASAIPSLSMRGPCFLMCPREPSIG